MTIKASWMRISWLRMPLNTYSIYFKHCENNWIRSQRDLDFNNTLLHFCIINSGFSQFQLQRTPFEILKVRKLLFFTYNMALHVFTRIEWQWGNNTVCDSQFFARAVFPHNWRGQPVPEGQLSSSYSVEWREWFISA